MDHVQGWLEKLEQFVKVNIKIDLSNFRLISVQKITIINDNKEKDKVRISDDKLEINYASMEESERQFLLQTIKEGFDQKQFNLLEDNSKERVDDIKEKSEIERSKEILNFFKDKICAEHWAALDASLYLREVFQEKQQIGELKRDIVHRYGEDGKNISNLCSAGYFDKGGYIREIYKEMSLDPDFSLEKFQKYFKTIVTISPFAVFVSKEMSEADVSGSILYRLETHKKYGLDFLAIHGLGKENVRKIKKIVHEIEVEKDLDVSINQDQPGVILVKILL